MNKYERALTSMKNGIIKYIDVLIPKLPYDRTLNGIIVEKNDSLYSVKIGNVTYEGIKTRGGVCAVNEFVYVKIPLNNFNNIYIEKF